MLFFTTYLAFEIKVPNFVFVHDMEDEFYFLANPYDLVGLAY